jgi:hypothetical protein
MVWTYSASDRGRHGHGTQNISGFSTGTEVIILLRGWWPCEFFYNIVLFLSIYKTRIRLQVISKLWHPSIGQTRQELIASARCDTLISRPGPACRLQPGLQSNLAGAIGVVAYAGRDRCCACYTHPIGHPFICYRQRASENSLFLLVCIVFSRGKYFGYFIFE